MLKRYDIRSLCQAYFASFTFQPAWRCPKLDGDECIAVRTLIVTRLTDGNEVELRGNLAQLRRKANDIRGMLDRRPPRHLQAPPG